MDDGLKSYVVTFLIVGLFIVSMFTFVFNFTAANKPIAGFNSEGVNLTGLQNTLQNTQEKAESWQESFSKDNPILALGELVVGSIWGVLKLIGDSIIIIFNIVFGAASQVLGIPPLALAVVSAILIMSIVLAIWKIIKTGQ